MNQATLAHRLVSDALHDSLLASKLASQCNILNPLEGFPALQRLRGCSSVVKRGLVGNSAWGRSMRAKQIIAARYRKKKDGL